MKTPNVLPGARGEVDPLVHAADVPDTILGQVRPARDRARRTKAGAIIVGRVLSQPIDDSERVLAKEAFLAHELDEPDGETGTGAARDTDHDALENGGGIQRGSSVARRKGKRASAAAR